MDEISNNTESSAELEQQKLNIKERFIADLKQAGIANDFAIEDVLARASFHATEFQGENRSYIKNSNGKIVDSGTLVDTLKEQLPSYFTGYVGNFGSVGSVANADNNSTTIMQEHYTLNLLDQISEGHITEINAEQKSALKNVFKYLCGIDYAPGSTKRMIGKYNQNDVHRLIRKVKGYKDGV